MNITQQPPLLLIRHRNIIIQVLPRENILHRQSLLPTSRRRQLPWSAITSDDLFLVVVVLLGLLGGSGTALEERGRGAVFFLGVELGEDEESEEEAHEEDNHNPKVLSTPVVRQSPLISFPFQGQGG